MPYDTVENDINTGGKQLDLTRRSSSRSIKRRKFDDEIVESSISGLSGRSPRVRCSSGGTSIADTGLGVLTSCGNDAFAQETTLMCNQSIENTAALSVKRNIPSKTATQLTHAHVGAASNRRSKKIINKHNVAAGSKDFGRWKPVDDLALIQAVIQTCDLRAVYQAVKFTCKFTFNEIAQRWYALLYDRTISRIALCAIRNLHPETVAAVEAKRLYSEAEQNILATIKSTDDPSLSEFVELHKKHFQIFKRGRTPKTLYEHWTLLKQYNLLCDQKSNDQPLSVPPLSTTEERNNSILNNISGLQDIPRCENIPNYQEYEELLSNSEPFKDTKDPVVDKQLAYCDRITKKEIRVLEEEINELQKATTCVTGISHSEFDNQTLAVLRGRFVRFLMRSKEITLGRETDTNHVDINLALEGPAWKISRRQATIILKNNGEFFIACEGKRPIYVDGNPILKGYKSRLNSNSVLEISGLRFLFLINNEFIEVIRQEATKLNLSGE